MYEHQREHEQGSAASASPGRYYAFLCFRTADSPSVSLSDSDDAIDGDPDSATVTLCAWTRAVRHEGEWISVETYLLSDCGVGEPLASARELAGQTFCHFTIQGEAVVAIPDTKADPVYRNVPTVKSLGIAAYLGAPLVLLSGEAIGAFCAVDQVPRAWTETQMQNARDSARLVVSEIELRQSAIDVRSVRE